MTFFQRKARELGIIAALLIEKFGPLWPPVWRILRIILIVGAILFTLPPIVRYWLGRIQYIPTVPISTIIETGIAACFMLSLALCFYLAMQVIIQLKTIGTGQATGGSFSVRKPGQVQATEGSFTGISDIQAAANEELSLLKKKGVINDDDRLGLEEAMNLLAEKRRLGK